MGVTGLWTVVQPCARPIKLETLNKKRLAVDASIWIYQFLKAVRDKEGNALRNSHVVGFFRRICKLLFVGILPVFVFDGGAPALKRQTITNRKRRREGRKEDAVRTAGKLLALQMQRAAEEEEGKRRREREKRDVEQEEQVEEDKLVYVDELQMTQQERVQNRRFRKKDQYHLPELETSMAEMGAPNDPRIMTVEELEAYARQFDTGEDINVYDFSKIDFDSPFFTSLPASDRYNILNAARLRSRLRMGYSKDQLDSMFPNRMDFSRFQIERVAERNELTQRLMNINGMNDDMMWGINGTGRVAGEKGREYVLVKNDGVEGGWALGVVEGRDEGQREKPIDVDELGERVKREEEEEEQSEEDFEDVPIEGLNRLPKPVPGQSVDPVQKHLSRQRKTFYANRKSGRGGTSRPRRARPANRAQDPESLFVADEPAEESSEEEAMEDNGEADMTEDEELNRAIAMSLQQETEEGEQDGEHHSGEEEENFLGIFQQKRVEDAPSFKGTAGSSGLAIARQVNARATKAPKTAVFEAESESEEDASDQAHVIGGADSTEPAPKKSKDEQRASSVRASVAEASRVKPKSNGPLPFEKLNLGSSLFGKKLEKIEEKQAGGFEKAVEKKDEARPLPPWFAGNLDEDIAHQEVIEKADREKAKQYDEAQQFHFEQPSVLRRHQTGEVIDLEAGESQPQSKEVLVLDGDDEEQDDPDLIDPSSTKDTTRAWQSENVVMGDLADTTKVSPPDAEPPQQSSLPIVIHDSGSARPVGEMKLDSGPAGTDTGAQEAIENDEEIDWSASEDENRPASTAVDAATTVLEATQNNPTPSRSPSPDFEDVQIPAEPSTRSERMEELATQVAEGTTGQAHTSGLADQNAPAEDEEDYGLISDSEDEDLMRQLEIEAQEHARFASELNQKTQQQNIAEYERELKQLRTQQKKDRRDADEVTQIMITECQQLLRLFGLPYITAPMEAEAQCAELVHLGLVDGIVTDDSDCFLFGGTRIYKNMFNQAKFVECYLLSDLEKEFDLTRQKLIGIAQLLGSDYTEGVPGIGPVTALEILSEFPDLARFKDWWSGVQEGRVKKDEDLGVPFRRKFRKNATKLFLPTSFPDPRVEMAYLQPEVDDDTSEFQWGVPDLDALRSFLMATIGWSQERTDEVLVPVIRDMNRRQQEGTQSNITKFFSGGTGAGVYAPRVRAAETSKRLGGALDRMAERAKAKRGGKAVAVEDVPEDIANGGGQEGNGHAVTAPASRPKRSRKRKSAAVDEERDADEDGEFEEPTTSGRKKRKAPTRRKKKATSPADDE
ncbi:DNA repair protein rad13 [Sphaceloma murrayae]|uniref:DNA repair protein rad13 n=1 Tax=Sphaceloma murrayae TaxID=2082308 RepID=A0A2K1QH13_9PEZI|nr:DNA repair protein rad13 [Sphaceloma murrayae]